MIKKHTLYFAVAALVLLFSVACKKESNKSPRELIQGKWILDIFIGHEHVSGQDYGDTVDLAGAGYYADFRTDGKVYSHLGNEYDTSEYTVLAANSIIIGGDTNQIKVLTANDFTLYWKNIDVDDYTEFTYIFKK